jgi:hypothetical protein
MANTFLTPDIIARQAYANLYENAVMAQLVHRDYAADFNGSQGDTITIRKPATFTAGEYDREDGITVQNATESGIAVNLDTLLDVSFAVTAEQLTLDLVDFNTQLLEPATQAILQGIDNKILTLRDDVDNVIGGTAGELWNTPTSLIGAKRELDGFSVPPTERSVVAGVTTSAEWLKDPLLHQADRSGSTNGLRDAEIGRVFGFDTYTSQNIVSASIENSVAFHKSAFALVVRTLATPQGASNTATFSGNGFGIRVVQDYDINLKQDVVSLDVLIGVKTLDKNRAVVITND